MGSPEDHPQSLEEAKARFLEEMGKLTPSAWIREHPDVAVGGALAAGFFTSIVISVVTVPPRASMPLSAALLPAPKSLNAVLRPRRCATL